MKKLLVLTSALLALSASMALAQGLNLGHANCGTTAASLDRTSQCNDNAQTFNLVAHFKSPTAIPDFSGLNAAVDVAVAGASLPPWWQVGTGGCREGGLKPIGIGPISGCQALWLSGNTGGYVIEPHPSGAPNKFRLRAQWAHPGTANLLADTRYVGLLLALDTHYTFDEGLGDPVCAGCQVAACLVLNNLTLFGQGGLIVPVNTQDVRQFATWQGGAVGGSGCPGETPARKGTWGGVKALYR